MKHLIRIEAHGRPLLALVVEVWIGVELQEVETIVEVGGRG